MNSPAELQQRLKELLAGMDGGIAMAALSGEETNFYCAGVFDGEDPRPITPDTQFETASIAKVFTGLLLARSERLGKVNRNDPAANYLLPVDDPDRPKLGHITLLLLATHHSGLPREPSAMPIATGPDCYPFAQYTREQLISALRTDGPGAPPDLAFVYSNFGFALLGQALAAAWHSTYARVLREHVLRPLGLTQTHVAVAGAPRADLAPGHARGKRISHWTFDAAAPCGGLRSSVRELTAFLRACLGSLDEPIYLDILETLRRLREAEHGCIGMGWGVFCQGNEAVYSHSGGIGGYRSFLGFNPGKRRGVVILTNNSANIEAAGCSFVGLPTDARTAPTVPDACDYEGRYPLAPSFAVRILGQDGHLFFRATGQPIRWLRPSGVDRFIVGGAPDEVFFERGSAGQVVSLAWRHGGQTYRGFRGDLPPAPPEVVLSGALLDEYEGQYALRRDFVLNVRHVGQGLRVQATGQSEVPIFAASKDEFFYRAVEASITFTRNYAGAVAGLVLSQNGRQYRAEKKLKSSAKEQGNTLGILGPQ